ncbi:MAG: hypothetical protein ACFFBC_12685 [Promethearchaeota archaeon]
MVDRNHLIGQIFKETDLVESLTNSLNQPFKSQVEDDLNHRLDCLRYLIKYESIDTSNLYSIVMDLIDIIFSEYDFNSIIYLKYSFIIYEIKEMELDKDKLMILKLIDRYNKELEKVGAIENLSNSEIIQILHYLLIKLILSRVYDDIEYKKNEFVRVLVILDRLIEKTIDDLETFELITFNIDLLNKFGIDEKKLYKLGKIAITNFLRSWVKYDRKSIEMLFIILEIMINLSIFELDLRLDSGLYKKTIKPKKYPGDFIYFFDDSDKKKMPKDIRNLIYELETVFNHDCKVATQILIRKIVEAAFYLKAEQEQKLDYYKNDEGEYKRLKEIPKVAKDLNFINKTFTEHAKRLISLGDIGTHNYKLIPKQEMLLEEIENLRMMLEHIFH